MNERHMFPDRHALYDASADFLATAILDAQRDRGEALIALSGGSTPGPIYRRLGSETRIDWKRVTVTLADERLTEPGDPDSNEALVRRTLLDGPASAARLVPLTEDTKLPGAIDALLLGMGNDGHIASLFPTAQELPLALSPNAPDVIRITPDPLPANAPYPRVSLSLGAILSAHRVLLAITGDDKRTTLETAEQDGPAQELPVRAILHAGHPHLSVFWAP